MLYVGCSRGDKLGLGTGSFMPGELCPALLFGSTIVMEGVV